MNSTTAKHDPSRRYLCRHVHADGRRCGSPALRAQNFCYYHNRTRLPNAPLAGRIGIFTMQPIDDRASIQIALFDILSRLTAGDIDSKLARTVLYGLQIASSNLAFREKQQPTTQPVEAVTTEPFVGDLAPIQEIPEANTEPTPAAAEPTPASEPAPTPVVSTAPISDAEPPASSTSDQSHATEEYEEDLPPIPNMRPAAIDPFHLTLAAFQACASQYTAPEPAPARAMHQRPRMTRPRRR